MNKLTICYHLPPDQDAAPFFMHPGSMRMAWDDVFERAEKWEELARDMAVLLERENVRHYELLIERMERIA